jgi:predicted aldo/keto reductase-like oxidoreductase
MKTMASGFFDKEKKKPINCKAALKFVLQDENVTTAIPGMTTFDQLSENASVLHDLAMSAEEKEALALNKLEGGLYCQGCETCLIDCKKGIPIPDLMRAYMYTYGYGKPALAHDLLTDLQITGNPCGDCSSCAVTCAKGFAVAEKIADISRLAAVPYEFLG